MAAERKEFSTAKRTYVSPRLVVYGDLKKITTRTLKGSSANDQNSTRNT
jgi:hypothetical protein